eukprot:4595235-Pleurochrysis_carterae.AAC.1
MYALSGEKFSELLREEFSGVNAVQRADYSCWRVLTAVEQGREASEKLADVSRSFVLVAHEANCFESRMVIDDEQGVSATTVYGRLKRTSDFDMY